MIRQRYILMIAIFISLMIMKSVNAHSDNDEEEDNFNHQKFVEYLDNKDFDDEDESDDYHRKHNHDEDGNCVMKFENSTTTDTTIDALDININPIRGINPTDGLTGARVCSGASIDPTFDRFTALFFGDFITFGGQDILGPLAVKGNFRAPNYVVNANRGQDCSSKDSLESYGLVVGGAVNTENTQIHGSIYAGKGGDLTGLVQLEHDCVKTGARGTGLVDFDDLEKKAIEYSFSLAAQHPTLVLGNDGAIKRVDQTRDGMEFITFNSCNPSSLCENIWPDAMSNPNEAIFGQGNWNGVKGNQPDPGITYVFNIPVVETTTLSINTNQPTVGFNGCRIVLNFYPIKTIPSSNDDYSTFSIVRNTGSPLYGFVLAPYGNIRDGSTGTFTGSVVGRSYTWANMNGVEIHDYRSGGLNCQSYDGCIPKGASNMMGSSSSSEGCVKTETTIYNNFETTTIDHTSTVYHTDTVGHTDTDIVYFYNTVTVDHTDIVDHTDTETTDKTITVDHTTTVGTIVVAAFTTTADNTVTSTKTDTDTTTRESTTTTTEQNTVTSTQDNTITTTRSTTETTTVTDRIENTVITTKDNTVTEDHTVFAANVVTTIEEVTTHVDIVTNNILTVSETETTTKILIGNVVVKPDTTYTEVNIQTVTLLMPTTATETSLSIQTETVINLIYDTVTVPSIKKELSTSILTIETHLVSTDTVTLLGAITNTVTTTATFTGCTTDILSSIQNNDQSKSEMPAPPPSTYTHIHNENCGHEYKKNDEEKHKYKNYQKK